MKIQNLCMSLCFIILGLVNTQCQKKTTEEKIQVSEDRIQADTLYSRAFDYMQTNFDSATVLINQLGELAEKSGDTLVWSRQKSILAYVQMHKANYDSAIYLYTECYAYAKSLNDTSFMDAAINNTGICFKNLGLYEEALDYYLASLKIKLAKGNERLIGISYNNIGNLYITMKEPKQAAEYLQKGLDFAVRAEFSHLESTLLNNMGNVFALQENLDSAIFYYSIALKLNEEIDYQIELARNHHNLGNTYNRIGKYASSKTELLFALQLREKLNLAYDILETKGALGKLYVNSGEFDKGLALLHEKEVQSSAQKLLNLKQEAFLELADAYEMQGNLIQSVQYRKSYDALKDSLMNDQMTNKIKAMEIKFGVDRLKEELDKSEYLIELQKASLQKEQYIGQLLLLVAVLLLSIIILMVLTYRRKLTSERIFSQKSQETLQAKLELLEHQKQMKDINSMVSAQEQERMRIARDLHDGLGGMLSSITLLTGTMKAKSDKAVSSEDMDLIEQYLQSIHSEIRSVSHNLMPASLIKFGLAQALEDFMNGIEKNTAISVSLEIDIKENHLDDFRSVMIYRILQESVNNILKHANASEIMIQILSDDIHMYLTIEDNGIGFDTHDEGKSKGIGMRNLRSRAHLLNGEIEIISEPGKGTAINLQIPIQNENFVDETYTSG